MQGPLRERLGLLGDTATVEEILRGGFKITSDVDEHTAALLCDVMMGAAQLCT